jgi:uncharacterized protein (TIRG00374 family)
MGPPTSDRIEYASRNNISAGNTYDEFFRSAMKILFVLLKISITLSLCFLLFSNINVDALRINLARLGALPIVAGVLLHFAVFLCGAFRWWILLKHTHTTTPFYKVFPSYYLGLFFNNLLPAGLGGDTARILHLRARGIGTKSLVSAAIMDRAIGISTVVTMGLCGVIVSEELGVPSNSKIILVTLFVAGLFFAGLLLTDHSGRFIEDLAQKYRHTRVRAMLLEIILTCYSYRTTKSRIAFAYLISAIGQSLIILIYYMLGRGLGLNLSLVTYFFVIPTVFLATSLPVSIGGLGIREGTLVGMLIAAGANLQTAINLSLVYLLVLWISTMPGALVILFSRAHKK